MSQELWQDIPQDIFTKIFIEDIQSFFTSGQPSVRGFILWCDLMKICKKWRNMVIEVTNTYPNFRIDACYLPLSNEIITILAKVEILDLSYTHLSDNDLKLLYNVIRINLAGNNQITNRGLSYLRNVEYLNIKNTKIILNKQFIGKLPKLKILVVDNNISILELKNTLGIFASELQIIKKLICFSS